ncbi:hypothetical protein [Neobacillus cucumis]|uniref:Uncharacterized protein n=1 Tax=Neobacillus cucumis TaxID=1740721 RepID=A0A2N5HAH5_9BACI|nr:hypothetical protein [Neobacillus cucumis]PLS02523.1 hypothetical protein CVD27_19510 [Neobacillus cucumis]
MDINISEILGARYDNLMEAQVDKSPDEVVVTNDEESFYIVSKEVFNDDLISLGYKIVAADGE